MTLRHQHESRLLVLLSFLHTFITVGTIVKESGASNLRLSVCWGKGVSHRPTPGTKWKWLRRRWAPSVLRTNDELQYVDIQKEREGMIRRSNLMKGWKSANIRRLKRPEGGAATAGGMKHVTLSTAVHGEWMAPKILLSAPYVCSA